MSTDLNSLLIGTSELSKKITNDNNSMINLNNDINLNILLIDDYIKNINNFSSDIDEQNELKNELLQYKSILLEIKYQLDLVLKNNKKSLNENQNVINLIEKSIQLNTGDIF